MAVDRVKLQQIVASQLPRYVREDFPLLTSFLEQYYVSLYDLLLDYYGVSPPTFNQL